MKYTISLWLGLIAACIINSAYALDATQQNKIPIRCYGKYILVFADLNRLSCAKPKENQVIYIVDHKFEKFIDAVIDGDKRTTRKFLKAESLPDSDDCIVAFYYAHRYERFEIERLLASSPLVQKKIAAEGPGLGLLLILSLEYQLSDLFDSILQYDNDKLRSVWDFCFNNALLYAVEEDLDEYADKLLSHPYINSRFSPRVIANLRIVARKKPYLDLLNLPMTKVTAIK